VVCACAWRCALCNFEVLQHQPCFWTDLQPTAQEPREHISRSAPACCAVRLHCNPPHTSTRLTKLPCICANARNASATCNQTPTPQPLFVVAGQMTSTQNPLSTAIDTFSAPSLGDKSTAPVVLKLCASLSNSPAAAGCLRQDCVKSGGLKNATTSLNKPL
jgi:hypothetical protein